MYIYVLVSGLFHVQAHCSGVGST